MNVPCQRLLTLTLLMTAASIITWGCAAKPIGSADSAGRRWTWNDMSLDQRKAHMKQVILPRAAELFRTWRPERFATVDCRLCHGQGIVSGKFHMPAAHLPRLSGKLLLGPEFERHPDTTRLKLEQLVPLMAQGLGKPTFNILTRRGFGCYSCHLGPSGPMFGN